MVWLVIAYAVMGIALAAFIGTGAYIIATVVAAMMLVPCGLRTYRAWRASPSIMICPNCGSRQVRITSRVEGMTGSRNSTFKRSLVLPRFRAKVQSQTGSQINRQRMAVCQSCGFDYSYVTAEEIKQERTGATRTAIIVCLLTALCVAYGALTH